VSAPRIVLVSTKDSANVGACARAMKNFGLDDLVLVAPRCTVDRRAQALASHASDVLEAARVVGTVEEAIADRRWVVGTSARLRGAGNFTVHTPRSAAAALQGGDSAVLFGPEDHGLDNDALNRCQAYVSIPTAPYASLNLAQAVVVVAYEWFQARTRSSTAAGAVDAERARAVGGNASTLAESGTAPPSATDTGAVDAGESARRDQMERFYRQLLATFHHIGFTDPMRERSVDRLFRGIFDRVVLSPREVAALRGLLSQVGWAADQPPERLPGRRGER
jgi:tRNA/rRNA methyltransferase